MSYECLRSLQMRLISRSLLIWAASQRQSENAGASYGTQDLSLTVESEGRARQDRARLFGGLHMTNHENSPEHCAAMTVTALTNAIVELGRLAETDPQILSGDCADLMLAAHRLEKINQKLVSKVGVTA